jgi:RNA polymerase sigma-70 factor (ECF subfamily)
LEQYSFDAEYLRRLKEGDGPTEEHFARYFGSLLRIKANSRLRSWQAADDVRQETLLRVLRNIRRGDIEHPERFGAYVNTVCNNVMLELFRRDSRWDQFPEGGSEPASGEAGAESDMVDEERRTLVRQALNELPSRDRELLQRIFLNEEDRDAVCQEFGVNRENLRVLLHRARGRLRSSIRKAAG